MLDASVVLAMMLGEDGGDQVPERLASSQISTVNLSQVVANRQAGGVPDAVIMSKSPPRFRTAAARLHKPLAADAR